MQRPISFSQYSEIRQTSDNKKYYTTTSFFRDDFDVLGLVNLMRHKYRNAQNVKVVSYGCSDGEETYSLALSMQKMLGKESEKFYPIEASDIDSTSVLRAKRGRFKVSDDEVRKLNAIGGLDLSRYINVFDDGLEKYAFVKESLKEKMNFSTGNAIDNVNDLDGKNTILICRNFWAYMSPKNQVELADKLAQKLDKSSLVVIGSFDITNGIDRLLNSKGFEKTDIDGVLQKK